MAAESPVNHLFTNKTLSMTLGPVERKDSRNPAQLVFRRTHHGLLGNKRGSSLIDRLQVKDEAVAKTPSNNSRKAKNESECLDQPNVIKKIDVIAKPQRKSMGLQTRLENYINTSVISEVPKEETPLNRTKRNVKRQNLRIFTETSYVLTKVLAGNAKNPLIRTPLFANRALQTYVSFIKCCGRTSRPAKLQIFGDSIRPFREESLNKTEKCIRVSKDVAIPTFTTLELSNKLTNTISMARSTPHRECKKNRHSGSCSVCSRHILRRIQRPRVKVLRRTGDNFMDPENFENREAQRFRTHGNLLSQHNQVARLKKIKKGRVFTDAQFDTSLQNGFKI